MTWEKTIARPDGLSDDAWAAQAKGAVQAAKNDCPVRTGRLKAGIRADVRNDAVVLSNSVNYAGFVFDGTSRQSAQDIAQSARDFLAQHGLF